MAKVKDITGQRFGRLTVIRFAGMSRHSDANWFCKCDCGGEHTALAMNLKKGTTTSCGCARAGASIKDLTGQRFGLLTVIQQAGKNKRNGARWACRCDCGGEKTVDASDLKKGSVTSCGCRWRIRRHGYTSTKQKRPLLYYVWRHMHERCKRPKDPRFKDYGGRGITVCERWNDFTNFLADVGERPSDKHSIDRINNDGNYEPSNIRWATPLEQRHNRRPEKPRKRIEQFTTAEIEAELERRRSN